jgi:hypothetical protein
MTAFLSKTNANRVVFACRFSQGVHSLSKDFNPALSIDLDPEEIEIKNDAQGRNLSNDLRVVP